ncbi:MAG: hypothetical protein ACI9J3_000036 [Parvicellaceae bacterium]|jgi:hypothetical protein
MKRKDPYSGEEFYPHRNNQKFASKENQIKFNNAKAQQKRDATATVNKWLNSNRNILKKLLGKKNSVSKSQDYLLGAGFHFHYFSNSAVIDGTPCQIIYEYYIVNNGDKTFTIKKLK